MIRLHVAHGFGSLVMFRPTYGLVAYIAEQLATFGAFKGICSCFLFINGLALRTLCAELDVEVIVLITNSWFKLHLLGYLLRLENSIEALALWLFLKMLLAFCIRQACPAKPSKAARALHMCTFRVLHQLKVLSALWIWACFGAIFKKKLIENEFSPLISLVDVYELAWSHKMIEYVEPVEYAPLKWMISFFAVQAKGKFAMLASSKVLILFNCCEWPATIKRAPSKVIHLSDGIV